MNNLSLFRIIAQAVHRQCERCGEYQDRVDRLHLCGCVEQMNLCRACLSLCNGDEVCGENWRTITSA